MFGPTATTKRNKSSFRPGGLLLLKEFFSLWKKWDKNVSGPQKTIFHSLKDEVWGFAKNKNPQFLKFFWLFSSSLLSGHKLISVPFCMYWRFWKLQKHFFLVQRSLNYTRPQKWGRNSIFSSSARLGNWGKWSLEKMAKNDRRTESSFWQG